MPAWTTRELEGLKRSSFETAILLGCRGYQPSKLRPREADGTAEPLSNDLEVEVLNK